MNRATYLLPIRRSRFNAAEAEELCAYFAMLRQQGCDVLVVDGSPPAVFAEHECEWAAVAQHHPVDRQFGFLNDKVNGIHTGVRFSPNENIILADDDVRYGPEELKRAGELLEEFEVVRPQNFFSPLPWWARMEAARMLINRATLRAADYPGTCAFRKSTLLKAGDYDGDVLFDNEEIIRHFAAARARICYANDLFVRKKPPTLRKWIEQRPRQAYEDFSLRFKTILFAALLPLGILFTWIVVGWFWIFAVSILLALQGWFRGKARRYFPSNVVLFAPLWVIERTLSTYWAFYWFIRYGGYPFGDRILSKGIGRDWIEGGKVAARQ